MPHVVALGAWTLKASNVIAGGTAPGIDDWNFPTLKGSHHRACNVTPSGSPSFFRHGTGGVAPGYFI